MTSQRLHRIVALFASLLLAAGCARAPARRPVVLIGWDAADWSLLDQLTASGEMPELEALVREGSSGTLRTIEPPLSPIVWTTMMTGRDPIAHGILDFARYHPVTREREPITSDERRVPAVWTIASAAGRSVAVFGMWATYPAERVNGVMVSDRLMSFQNGAHPEARGAVYPESRSGWARAALARAESAVTPDTLHAVAPDVERDPRLFEGLRRTLVETAVYDELAMAWFRENTPDLTVLYLQGTDAIGHLFAPYRPPRMREVDAADVARWGRSADRYYAEVDRRLGAWRRLAAQRGAVIVLVSDHGFFWGEGRPAAASAAVATAGKWHREDGIYVVSGPGIAATAPKAGHGEAAQVAPTLLALAGLPADRAMPAPLPGVAEAALPPTDYAAVLPSHTAPAEPAAAADDEEAIANLRALGYIGGAEPGHAPPGAGASTRTAASFGNEGLILLRRGTTAEARRAFERALAVDPRHAASLWNLAQVLAGGGAAQEAETMLLRALAAGSPDAQRHLLGRARQRMGTGDCAGALADVRAVASADPGSAIAPAAEGLALMCLGDRAGAAAALRRSLAIDPDQPELAAALASLR